MDFINNNNLRNYGMHVKVTVMETGAIYLSRGVKHNNYNSHNGFLDYCILVRRGVACY